MKINLGLTIKIHELNETMSDAVLTHIFSNCWLTSTSSYEWSYAGSDSAVSYQLGFSFLSYEIEEDDSGEFSSYLTQLQNKKNKQNTTINNTKTQTFNEMEKENTRVCI
jgi:hypothetical protein